MPKISGLLTALANTPIFWDALIVLVVLFSEPLLRLITFYYAAGSKVRSLPEFCLFQAVRFCSDVNMYFML